jgi:pSer/pThr/pTyr-binding forkhead associated (FHA) protein
LPIPGHVIYFLDRFPDEPVELHPRKTCRIGRGPGSDVFVPDVDVSRCHADIRWERGAFIITDLGSANGTLVNGERITERGLTPGDEIRVGSTMIRFRVEDSATMKARRLARERHVREVNTAASYSPVAGGFAGAVADVPLADVVQVLERAQKTGRLYVCVAESHGTLGLREGRVVGAAWYDPSAGELADHEAAHTMLALSDGVFEFVAEPVPDEARIDASPQALILEAMRRADERDRADRPQI